MSELVSDEEWSKLGFGDVESSRPKPIDGSLPVSDEEWSKLGFAKSEPQQSKPEPVIPSSNKEQVFGPFIDNAVEVAGRLADGSNLVALGEVAATMATGIFATTAGGLSGVAEGIAGMVSGDPDALDAAVNDINRIASDYTYEPKTDKGKDLIKQVAGVGADFEQDVRRGGNQVLDATGSPEAAAAFHTYGNFLPTALGLRLPKGGARSPKAERQAIAQADAKAEKLGINLESRPRDMEEQIMLAGEQVEGLVSKGDASEAIQLGVQKASELARKRRNEKFQEARNAEAQVDSSMVRDVNRDARAALEDFDMELMPIVEKRLAELEKMSQADGDIDLQRFYGWYRRINAMKPPANDLTQATALGILRGTAKSRLDAEFNADMIKGDASSVTKWKDALKSHSDYVKTFKEQRVIRDLAEQQATPAEVRQWIVGANSVLPKAKVTDTVARLNDILGRESIEMQALRADLKLDIIEPLLREQPSVPAFVKNYDKMVRKNPDFAKEMLKEGELADLAEIARAVERGKATNWQSWSEWDKTGTVGRFMFGHGLAKAAARQGIGTAFLRAFTTPIGHNQRTRIINEYLGIDERQSLFNTKAIQSMGMLETMEREAQLEQPSP